MTMSTRDRFPLSQRGMTLVEVMVGLAIGMIGMLVIFQTVSVWDARTRATSAGSDSQVTGSIAMYSVERDLRLAGQGFGGAESPVMGCQVAGFDQNASAPLGFPMTPVVIVDHDATNEPDEIATLYGTSSYFTSTTTFNRVTAQTASVWDRTGIKSGDLVVLANAGTGGPGSADCQLVEATDEATPADHKTLAFVQGSYPHYYFNGANLPSRYNDAAGLAASMPGGTAYSLGPLPRRNVWSIASGVLGSRDELQGSVFFPVAEGVVDMKAEYGYDADPLANSLVIAWNKTLPTPIDWTSVRAVRIAMLVRSRNFEKPATNATEQTYIAPNPVWHANGGAAQVNFVMRNVDGTPDSHAPGDPSPNNWRNYRYTVYEKVFPLRNVIWGQ
ncbi:MAG: PilW family protein [Burkholderiales bacterium]|nr:PilW family protein [Burkholderiales bacterium]